MKTQNGVTYYEDDEMPAWPDEAAAAIAACPAHTPDDATMLYFCTRAKGHGGHHKAQVVNNRVCAEW